MEPKQKFPRNTQTLAETLSFIPLGGIEDVTKNMYLYEYKDEILIVECGIGFADETMLGVDLLLPDISYLLKTNKKIVGMVLSHGHEDHIGATPFILPQLPNIPVYASPLTAALTNEKLQEFHLEPKVKPVTFDGGDIQLGSFTVSFIRITHSVPDSTSIFIKTPAGNFYHAADFKFDLTPADGKPSDYRKIAKTSEEGVLCLMSDCLGSERPGFTISEANMTENFENVMKDCLGKFIVTTYSSNIVRINQVITAAERLGRKVCFIGRSLVKVKEVGLKIGYLHIQDGTEITIEELKQHTDEKVVLIVAGSQGQENSALTRIANGEHKDVKLAPDDVIVFSSDAIPGNEVLINALLDAIAKRGAKSYHGGAAGRFHVSGHGSSSDLMLMMSLTKPKHVLPISGNYTHMVAYKGLAEQMGYAKKNIHLLENGQEIIFSKDSVKYGRKIPMQNVYVDQISGEEVENFVLRDREKLAKEGIIIIMVEVNASDGQLADKIEIVGRGFSTKDTQVLSKSLSKAIKSALATKRGKVSNWVHMRKQVTDIANKHIFKELRRRPLVLPVVIEI